MPKIAQIKKACVPHAKKNRKRIINEEGEIVVVGSVDVEASGHIKHVTKAPVSQCNQIEANTANSPQIATAVKETASQNPQTETDSSKIAQNETGPVIAAASETKEQLHVHPWGTARCIHLKAIHQYPITIRKPVTK